MYWNSSAEKKKKKNWTLSNLSSTFDYFPLAALCPGMCPKVRYNSRCVWEYVCAEVCFIISYSSGFVQPCLSIWKNKRCWLCVFCRWLSCLLKAMQWDPKLQVLHFELSQVANSLMSHCFPPSTPLILLYFIFLLSLTLLSPFVSPIPFPLALFILLSALPHSFSVSFFVSLQ